MRRGLVVGKFSPLHRGHELLIETALADCDELFIISYSKPELPGCEPARREAWLAELFPSARRLVVGNTSLAVPPVPDNDDPPVAHRRFVGALCWTCLGTTIDVVYTSEDYGEPFARELTAYFRGRAPGPPAVEHVAVDPARARVPISASRIRADVHGMREWLSPAVYASFVQRIGILGGESSGKTTLAEALARACGTAWVPEYGRALWEERGGALRFDDLLAIARRQIADEDAAVRRANRFLFCDSTPLTTLFYCRDLFDRADPALERLSARPYDLIVLCAPDFPFVQDGTRRDEAFRARQHAWYLERLSGTPWVLATGSVADRVAAIRAALG
jgi:HTH-type transcriptional regulator, transcriptional repressor of NAD biosynthesis genes